MEFSLLSCRCRLHNFTFDKILNQPLKCLFRLQVANIDTYKEIKQNKKINLQWVINLLRNLNFLYVILQYVFVWKVYFLHILISAHSLILVEVFHS